MTFSINEGLQVAQLKLIFSSHILTTRGKENIRFHPSDSRGKILAYVEWFSKAADKPHGTMQMYGVSRMHKDGRPRDGVIELRSIVQPCYLLPRFKTQRATDLDIKGKDGSMIRIDGDNCLDLVDDFWINCFQDQMSYQTVF